MYDPFATPPPPGTAAPLVAPPQGMSQPSAPNNALAAIYNKHMRNLASGIPGYGSGGPVATGQPIPGPNTQFPLNPGMGGPGGMPDWRQNFMQARSDWRGNMPDQPTFDGERPDDWRTQMQAYQGDRQDWRQSRPRPGDYRMGTVPASGA